MTRYSLPPARKPVKPNILTQLMLRMVLRVGRCHPMTFLKLAVAFTSVTSLIAFMCIIYPGFHADVPEQANHTRQPIQASTANTTANNDSDPTFPLMVWSLGSIALGCILGSVLLSSWFQPSSQSVKSHASDRPKLAPKSPVQQPVPTQPPVITVMSSEVMHPLDHHIDYSTTNQWPSAPATHPSPLIQPQQWTNVQTAAAEVNLAELLDLRKRYGMPQPQPQPGYTAQPYQFEPQHPNSSLSCDRYQNG